MPGTVLSAMRQRLRSESEGVILPAEDRELSRYLSERKKTGTRTNLNQLGEAILGEDEARHRLDAILGLLARPDVDYISVKISAIFSQINLLAWDETLSLICERLRLLYVGITRARRDLILTWNTGRRQDKLQPVVPFIALRDYWESREQ